MAKDNTYTEKDFVDVYDEQGNKLDPVPKKWLGTDLLPTGVSDKKPAGAGEVTIPDGEPSEEWTGDQLKAYAKREDLSLGGASSKGDIVKAIADAKAAKASS